MRVKPRIRLASVADIDRMIAIDNAAWWEGVAFTREQLESQLRIYPEGTWIAEIGTKAVGFVSVLRITSTFAESIRSWNEATGNGFFTTHDPKGDVLFGANLSVVPEYQRLGIGDHLFATGFASLVRAGMRYGTLGGRLPGLAALNGDRVKNNQGRLNGTEYADLKDDKGRVFDPELRFYLRQPFAELMRVIPDYFPDPESEDNGALLRVWNPLFKWRLSWMYRVPLFGWLVPHLLAFVIERAP